MRSLLLMGKDIRSERRMRKNKKRISIQRVDVIIYLIGDSESSVEFRHKGGAALTRINQSTIHGMLQNENQGNRPMRVRKNKQQIGQCVQFACCLWPWGSSYRAERWGSETVGRKGKPHRGGWVFLEKEGSGTSGTETGRECFNYWSFEQRLIAEGEREVRFRALDVHTAQAEFPSLHPDLAAQPGTSVVEGIFNASALHGHLLSCAGTQRGKLTLTIKNKISK